MTDQMTNQEQEILQSVAAMVANTSGVTEEVLRAELATQGIVLQPYDLWFVLSRHPSLFKLSERGRWKRVGGFR